MRTFSRGVALAMLVGGAVAHADSNDFELAKLGNPDPGESQYDAGANGDFRAFARTFAAALTSVNLMPPETLGHSAFAVNVELGIINLPDDVRLPTAKAQPDVLLLPALHFRKGLPFSLELGTRVGWVDKSQMFAATGELKWAVNEGFTYLPDVAVRLHVTRLLGNRDFDLTATGFDIGAGKQFPLGGMVTLTPYGGLDFVGVAASSDTLDFRQNRPYNDTLKQDNPYAGLDDTAVYEEVLPGDNINSRLYGGVRFIGGVLQLGAEVSLTRQGSIEVKDPATGAITERSLPAVLAFSTTLGLDF